MDYYVYGHYDQDELVYIGYGRGGRVAKSEGRSMDHKKWMEKAIVNKDDFYSFFLKDASRKDARALEKKLIKESNTRFNKEYTPEWYAKRAVSAAKAGLTSANKKRKSVNTPDGFFKSLVEAGKFYGVNQNTIRNRVRNNWEGYSWAL